MADRAPRGSRHHEPSLGLDLPLALRATASEVGGGSALPPSTASPTEAGQPETGTLAPTPRATFRHLQQQGLTAGEAASLTAFMCGMPAADPRRSLLQLNHLLFLERVYRLGRFEIGEGERLRPH